jgi:hypothetical protein
MSERRDLNGKLGLRFFQASLSLVALSGIASALLSLSQM